MGRAPHRQQAALKSTDSHRGPGRGSVQWPWEGLPEGGEGREEEGAELQGAPG